MGIKITDPKKLEELKRINKTIIHGDEMDSFEMQILSLMTNQYDIKYPMIIDSSSLSLDYIERIDKNTPLVMSVDTLNHIQLKHPQSYVFAAKIDESLNNSVLSFDSMTEQNSVVVLLDEFLNKKPIIASCRLNREIGSHQLCVNQITSVYDKKNFERFITRTYDANYSFYKTNKIERYLYAYPLQLRQDLQYALSNNYNRQSFTKSQVEADIGKEISWDEMLKTKGKKLTEKIYAHYDVKEFGAEWFGYNGSQFDVFEKFEDMAEWMQKGLTLEKVSFDSLVTEATAKQEAERTSVDSKRTSKGKETPEK